jgi:hypothetical protein
MPLENSCSTVGISERQIGLCDGSSHLAYVFPLVFKQERRRLSSMSTLVEETIIGRSLGVVFAVIVLSGPGSSGPVLCQSGRSCAPTDREKRSPTDDPIRLQRLSRASLSRKLLSGSRLAQQI